MSQVLPRHPWEVPVTSLRLISTALCRARPAAQAAAHSRLDGLPDDEVADRYERLAAACRARPVPALGRPLDALEPLPPGASPSEWETFLLRTGASDDEQVVELARDVWVALGPNEYARHLRERPRTWRGFHEGRNWASAVVLVPVLVVLAGVEWGWDPLLVLLLAVGSVVGIALAFRNRYRRLARHGAAELPHL